MVSSRAPGSTSIHSSARPVISLNMPKNKTLTRTCSHSNRRSGREPVSAIYDTSHCICHNVPIRFQMKSAATLTRLLLRLEAAKRQFHPGGQAHTAKLLSTLGRRHFQDPHSLIRFHESLLFFRAYPADEEIRRIADNLLGSFPERIARLR